MVVGLAGNRSLADGLAVRIDELELGTAGAALAGIDK